MKARYLADTDTLSSELCLREIAETQDLDENTIIDWDVDGNVRALTSSMRAGASTSSM